MPSSSNGHYPAVRRTGLGRSATVDVQAALVQTSRALTGQLLPRGIGVEISRDRPVHVNNCQERLRSHRRARRPRRRGVEIRPFAVAVIDPADSIVEARAEQCRCSCTPRRRPMTCVNTQARNQCRGVLSTLEPGRASLMRCSQRVVRSVALFGDRSGAMRSAAPRRSLIASPARAPLLADKRDPL